MDIYDNLLEAVHNEYDTIRLIKKSKRGEVSLVRHRDSGTRYIFRHFYGSSEVYQLLLTISCPYLPQIMEVGERDGRTVLLEEYVQGDTLRDILECGLLTVAEARQITRQLCSALWVLHSMGVVHRDVKPDNVIVRGKEAVLIDFDASRIYKSAIQEDTQILGTTGFAAPEQYGLSQWFFRNYPLLLLYPMYLNFASSNCLPHLPYIVRFIIFNLLLVPSTNPLL